ncbi:DUF262 domain-containing protein [Paenibacillus dendritiformis]|uniref:DUF262 domain-containing protein n=1 Tax=Paenibacillus dendritiformis TaxID=130049 RepID=UPI00387E0263
MTKPPLAERIANKRIENTPAIQRTVKSLARNPKSVNTRLVIQRNLKWTVEQKSSLIESILLGYPIPPIYTLRSNDNQLWILDGNNRVNGTLISFVNDEWELDGLDPVYDEDINGKKFSELPKEFRELIEDKNLTFYQFERLTTEQRDQLFKRLNSGTPLSKIELIRSILGSENLDYLNSILDTPFMHKAAITDSMKKGFKDQELVLQAIGLLTGRIKDVTGKSIEELAIDLRVNGLTESEKELIHDTFSYLSRGFKDIEEKVAKKALKKADVVAITMCAKHCDVNPEVFANLIIPFINTQKSGSPYSNTKGSGSATHDKVQKRIELLKKVVLGGHNEHKQEAQIEDEQQEQKVKEQKATGEQLELAV